MEIILQQDFPALGYVGDRVKVKGGYARNFLIPRGIGIEASIKNEKLLQHRLGGVNARRIKLRGKALEYKEKLESVSLAFFLRVGGSGKSFGSITSKDIEQSLHKEGFVLDRKQIVLTEPIKKVGEHKVLIKLHSEVMASVLVKVNSEVPEVSKEKSDSASDGKKGGKTARKPRARKAKVEEGETVEKEASTEQKEG